MTQVHDAPDRAAVRNLLGRGSDLLRAGRAVEAEALFAETLRHDPGNFEALHLLGVVALKTRRPERAAEFIGRAIALNPNFPVMHNTLACALTALGRHEAALAACDAALALNPNYIDAHINRGLALFVLRRFADALESYDRAIAINPRHLPVHINRANLLNALARHEEALAACDAALALHPNSPEAHVNRANALNALNRHAEALLACDAALRLHPDFAQAHLNRSTALMELKRFEEALAACDAALALHPGHVEALISCSSTLNILKRHAEALVSADAAIALDSNYAEAHINRAHALIRLDRAEEALPACDAALALNPSHVEATLNRSGALIRLHRAAEALADADKTLVLDPQNPHALVNRGNALLHLERHAEALSTLDKVIALMPDYAGAHSNRAQALASLKRYDEAFDGYARALALKPDLTEAHSNRGTLLLSLGRLEEGFRDYEFRKPTHLTEAFRAQRLPLWRGEDIAGKTLLILQELLVGDVLHFCRYAKLAEAQGARVILLTQKKFHRLLKSMSPTIEVVSEDAPLPSFDYYCPLFSLPIAFKTSLETIYAPIPYLHAEPDLAAKWKAKLGRGGFKIGICWQGSALPYAAPLARSCALRDFAGLSHIPGVCLISLQKYAGVEQLDDLPPGMNVEVPGDFDSGPDAFIDTAAIMGAVDLVITIDTSVVHLAGALGRPVWVALKDEPEWRWLRGRGDSPWYPAMRLFRQRVRGEWGSVFAEMEAELTAMQRRAPDAIGA